jgi:hypothetical protein
MPFFLKKGMQKALLYFAIVASFLIKHIESEVWRG